jgi:hypothetical protein
LIEISLNKRIRNYPHSSDILKDAFVSRITLHVSPFHEMLNTLFDFLGVRLKSSRQKFSGLGYQINVVDCATRFHNLDNNSLNSIPSIVFNFAFYGFLLFFFVAS